MPPRTIIHLDMNAFFASVEQQCNPALLDKPIAVVGRGSRTVVTTASYEARAFGVKTGMNKFEAQRQCPHIIFVEGNNRRYAETCEGFTAMCRTFTPLVEVFSIDEVFMDVTGSLKIFSSARDIIARIKQQIKNKYGLTCSAGIAPNKLLAKLASDREKPDGLVDIPPDTVLPFLENLPVQDLCGIGNKTQAKLALLGITTCGQLGRADAHMLTRHFGVMGDMLRHMGRGEDDSPVVPLEETPDPKSIGHSHTLPSDITRRDLLDFHLLRLSEMVGRRARDGGFAGRTVCLTIRYKDFTTFTRRVSVSHPICETPDIFGAAKGILDGIKLQQAVRLVGVALSQLGEMPLQLPLFTKQAKSRELTRAMDEINNRFGDFTLTWGSMLEHDDSEAHGGVISPAWRPEGPRKIEF
ncbi:MAG: DNA polymerase IV [Deltaproteobacteria bacterium]|nr:DNA polymerase IV [Deltaproteobacteria bacterium]